MNLNRVTEGVRFDTGISSAQFNETPAGQTAGQTQGPILPGSTTVSAAMDSVFPPDATVSAMVIGMLARAGASVRLRTGGGFRAAAGKAASALRARGTPAAAAAAAELDSLLADTELLDRYRAGLIET